MIKCNRCGKMNAAGIANCQQCGTPLSTNKRIENGFGARQGAPEQSELPAWLETLRAGERPAAPISNPQNFSTADLIEEGALPSWMRSERNQVGDSNPTNPRIPATSAPPFSGPQTGEGTFPSQGIAAQSLIDERSLPAWMQEGQQSTPVPTSGIAASSLLAQDSVPDWMKTLQPQSPNPASRPLPTPQPAQPSQPMPPQVSPVQPPSSALPGSSQGFSAGDLIDPQALPAWMKQQSGSFPTASGENGSFPATPVQSGPGAPVNNFNNGQAGQQGFSASSLLDMNSLPPWLREGGNEQSGSSSAPSPAAPAYQSGSWQAPEPPSSGSWQAPAPSSPQTPAGNGLAASSFIDMNSLPEWLRSAADQSGTGSGAQSPAQGQRAGAPGIPPRVENMRVPSRPRTEWNASESSEVAANVFASMLGVASAAPQYPSAQAQAAPYAPPATPQGMPPQTPGMPPTATGNLPGGVAPAQGPNNVPGMPPQGYAPGAYPAYGDSSQGYYQQGAAMMPAGNGAGAAPGMPGEQKNKKRGLVEALRDWLFR